MQAAPAFSILVDADACPVKEEIYRVAKRYGLAVKLIAGQFMRIPEDPAISLEVVAAGIDAADDRIVELVQTDDIVITGDIPLAARCLAKGAHVIGHGGKPFTPDNIGALLATRDLLSRLREGGEMLGGPPPFEKRHRSSFLQALDQAINTLRRARGRI